MLLKLSHWIKMQDFFGVLFYLTMNQKGSALLFHLAQK